MNEIVVAVLLLLTGLTYSTVIDSSLFALLSVSVFILYFILKQSHKKDKIDSYLSNFSSDEFGIIFNTPNEEQSYYDFLIANREEHKIPVLRLQQVIRQSFEIVINTKNIETAQSRLKLAEEKYTELTEKYLFKENELRKMKNKYDWYIKEYQTLKYINQSIKHEEHIKKVKTLKSKIKYLNLAKAVLEDGLKERNTDKRRIEERLKELPTDKEMEKIAIEQDKWG